MATQRDRYQNHTYSESRDRGRAQHALQDLGDVDAFVIRHGEIVQTPLVARVIASYRGRMF